MRWALGLVWISLLYGSTEGVDFARQIQPIFEKRCQSCHGPRQQMSGLRLDDGTAALKGGASGPVIVPGKSAESKLVERISSDRRGFVMPPAGPPLAAADVARIKAWIDQGARWTAPAKAASAVSAPSHWSFQPIRRPPLPAVSNRAWVRNPVDAFVLARLESEGIRPSPEAGRNTLIRRLSLDLTGLPPAPAEVEEFLSDNRPDACERLVDRLLASPHYGERWARPWLDLARYADSDGYEKDQVRPYAWRYRHWLIGALNRDLPFDQFTLEQLAGDLLPGATTDQRVATGFQRNTLTNREAGTDREEARFEQIVNRTNTVSTVWLGLTAGCAQCHDHKYDPISQKDYYRMAAFWHGATEQEIDAPLDGEMGPYLAAKPDYDRRRDELLAEYRVLESQAVWEENLRKAIDKPGVNLEWDFSLTSMKAMFDDAVKTLKTDPTRRGAFHQARLTRYFLQTPGPDLARDKLRSAELKEAREKLAALDSGFPWLTRAAVLAEDPQAGPAHVRVRGDWKTKGEVVEPAGLSVLAPIRTQGKPTRLDLARWLVSPDNPLTARVTVNRAWQELFGRGLVATSEDFGSQGEKPSHPELLDWLASELLEGGWSVKRLHRLIVTSATYRQSSRARPELAQRDPENTLLARQSRLRLSAELVRDAALAAGGLLNTSVGGRSVRPPQPAGVAELGYAGSVKWKESQGPDRYRRGLYIHFQRTTPYPQLMLFDAPDSNVACSRRRRSNTPLQALNLLNDPVFFEAAQALAVRELASPDGDFKRRLARLYQLTLAREPGAAEQERLARFFNQQFELFRKDPKSAGALLAVKLEGVDPAAAAAWVGVSRVLLNLDEFITRE